eukprot:scaffold100331_cov51-Attheya_sp.AAC.7
MPKGLKIQNRYGTLIYDSAWIEGVEYTADKFDDYNYDESNSEDLEDQEEDKLDDEYDDIDPEELDDIQQEGIGVPPYLDEISQEDVDKNEVPGEENKENLNNTDIDEDEEEEEEASSDEESDKEKSVNSNTVTRSGRISKAAEKLNLLFHSAESFYQDASDCDIQDLEGVTVEEYTSQNARVLANFMCHITNKVEVNEQFLQTFSLNRGIKVFGEKGKDAAFK